MKYPKLCIFCKKFFVSEGFWGSDVTPPDPTTLQCAEGKWGCIDIYDVDEQEFRKIIMQAESCEHWEQVKDD